MGLIDLKTDLKSLRYGKDTIGGGYSGQPYIQTPIPESFNDLGANEDFILRGGINAVRDSATDIKRLTKMFFDLKSPNGLLFIAKQNILSNTAVRTQTSDVVNEGIYTPLNTLAEAGVVAFGGYLNKQGINPFEETGAYANNPNLYSVKVKTDQLTENNRLARLYQLISTKASDKLDGFILNNGNVLTYDGGPNSILGIGKTNIRFASQRTGNNNALKTSNPNYFIGSDGISGTPVYLSEREDIPNYINSFTGSRLIDTNNTANNPLLARDEFKVLSPFVANNFLVTTVIPESQRTTDSFYVKSVDTIYLEGKGKQQGGLEITTEFKPWIKSDQYELPDFNVNSPQSGSLSKIPTGPFTDNSKQDITNPSGATYLDQINDINNYVYDGGATNKYKTLTGQISLFSESILVGNKFKPNWKNNVHTQGNTFPENSPAINDGGTYTYNQQDIIDQEDNHSKNSDKTGNSPTIQDFRKKLRDSKNNQKGLTQEQAKELGQLTNAPIYFDYNVGVKNQIGNPGQRSGKSYASYTAGVTGGDGGVLDKINASPVGTSISDKVGGSKNDLVTFNIISFNGQTMNFRAFLDSFSDNFASTINSQQYVGRGENFYTYQGFTRKISLSWTVAALSKQELIPMYKKLSYLASNTAPVYSNGFMQGPLVKLTVGGYVNEIPGYIEGLTFDLLGGDTTWEIGINDIGEPDPSVAQLPHILKVTGFNFTPIPNYLPQRGARFIDLWNGDSNLWDNDIKPQVTTTTDATQPILTTDSQTSINQVPLETVVPWGNYAWETGLTNRETKPLPYSFPGINSF